MRRDLTGQLSAVPEWIRSAREAQQRSVVLATGDPLCHGIASYLASRLCIEAIEVLQKDVAERFGFDLTGHIHELLGLCKNCRPKLVAAH